MSEITTYTDINLRSTLKNQYVSISKKYFNLLEKERILINIFLWSGRGLWLYLWRFGCSL